MSKLSVIVPVYNTEKYVEKCLESIINQTIKNIEIIIVNDGSTDSSEKVIKEFISQHAEREIRYFKKKNGGLSDARNFGVQKANRKIYFFY